LSNLSRISASLPQSVRRTFIALKYPNYRLWFGGQLISLVGTWMQATAQGYLIYTLTNSAKWLGVVGFASGIPTWLFTLYGGVIADRIPRRTLMLITQSVMMVLAFILAGLVYKNIVQPWEIVVLAFLLGVANAFDAPARQSFVVELVDREDLTNGIALNSTMFNLATVVGPAVAGLTYAAFGPAWCFAINGLSFLGVIIALLLMKLKSVPQLGEKGSAMIMIREGLKFVKVNPNILVLLSSLIFLSVFGFGLMTLMPVWAVTILGGDVTTNGFLLSARGIGALIGALTVAALAYRRIKGKIWTIGSFILPVTLFLFSFTRILPLSFLLLIGVGWGLMTIANTTNAMVQEETPDELRSRVMSLYVLVFQGGMPIGALVIGLLAAGLTAPVTVAICAVILLGYAIFSILKRPEIRITP
jgi:predicted MFS family arabinose efflux permease